jgi:Fe-S-cluster-containing dehydrogenase component/DMSO reductase anchor subunit
VTAVAVQLGRRPEPPVPGGPELLPLDAGEQYRFVFDMTTCVGCHSCEVACAEQNGNPTSVNWRKVGEIEAGSYPTVRRMNLSMACNHCLEPTCLSGCPTNAYIKLDNGVVKHHAESCIGCQYCIWNCPYEAPVFNPERRIVTKCDLCLPRLEAGQAPACVAACPTGALKVEKVAVAEWRDNPAGADAPGLPPSAITRSTTRIILPSDLPADAEPARTWAIEPEDPHWPLIALTLLTQLAVGTVASTVALQALTRHARLSPGAVAAAAAGLVALLASIGHLGRPAHAWKALRNLRHSWLSREVALFGGFAGTALAYAATWPLGITGNGRLAVGVTATALGLAGIFASARLYLVPARPVWHSPRTVIAFFATTVASGPVLAALALSHAGLPSSVPRLLVGIGATATVAQLAVYQHLAVSVAVGKGHEWTAFGQLLFRRFRGLLAVRIGCGLAALVLAAWAGAARPASGATTLLTLTMLVAVITGELIGRYLFYVTVVPMTADGSFFRGLR